MPYDKELSPRLRALIPSAAGQRLFRNVVNSQLKAGKSESVSFASAWAALEGAGYSKVDGKWVKKAAVTKAFGAKPIYMKRPVLNAERLQEWAGEQGLATTLPPDDMHVTVVYSKDPFSVELTRQIDNAYEAQYDGKPFATMGYGNIVVRGGHRSMERLGPNGGAYVLRIESPELAGENAMYRQMGASTSWPDFKPHITITWKAPEGEIEPFMGDIVLGPLIALPLNEDWKSEMVEVPTPRAEIAKRQVQDDMFTMPDEARARSVDLGLEGRIHVASDDLQGYYMPGEDHDEYVAALEQIGMIMPEEEPDETPTPEGLVEQIVAALIRTAAELDVSKRFDVLKADEEQRIVWGWASVSTVKGELMTDTQGDVIEPGEMVKMANAYMNTARAGKVMHFGEPVAKMLHSFPLTKELGDLLGVSSDREGWIVGMKIEDDTIWKMVKQGTFTGFSIGGRAKKREARQ